MTTKGKVWLTTKDILTKYHNYCDDKNITERFLVRLYDADLLIGYNDRKKRKVEILESSFLELVKHIAYNFACKSSYTNTESISAPHYCYQQQQKRYSEIKYEWYTATEIISYSPELLDSRYFTVEFLNELTEKFVLRGKYDASMRTNLILHPSFLELMKYRNYTMKLNMYYE